MEGSGNIGDHPQGPRKTLRQICVEAARRRGKAEPDCGVCPLNRFCMLERLRVRRAQKKAVRMAGRARARK